ncbi:MAG: hypothetical protein AAFZ15_33885 [Bacteroidota bacterium]
MQNSKLVHSLRILTPRELKRLYQFLKSPFYNASPNITNLYLLLRRHYPSFDSAKLDKIKVFKKLFPSREYDHQKLLNLMSDFNRLLEKYLIILQLEKEELEQQKLLLKSYAGRPGNYDLFEKTINHINQITDKFPFQDEQYYQIKYWLDQQYLDHPGTDKFKLKGNQYKVSMDYLDKRYILEKLLLSCEMKTREKPLSEKHEIWLLDEILNDKRDFIALNSVAGIYVEMLMLLKSNKEESYHRLKELSLPKLKMFNKQLQQNILQCLINFTIQKGNAGDESYIKENLELYKLGLEYNLLANGGAISDIIYLNIISIASKAGDINWCLHFINNYSELVEKNIRTEAKAMGMIIYYFYQNNADKIIEELNSISYVNDNYQLQARSFLLKLNYQTFHDDLNYFEVFFSQSESFEKYLRRNTAISEKRKKRYINHISAIKKIAKAKIDKKFRNKSGHELRQQIIETKNIYSRSWLLEQVDKL